VSASEHVEKSNQLKLFMSPREIMQRNWSKTEPRPRAVEAGKRMDGGLDDLMPVKWVEPKDRNHDLFYKGTHGQFEPPGGRSQQLKMFMTPREVMRGYGPHDADRWITGTEAPEGFSGVEGDRFTHPPLMMFARPEQYGIPTKFDDPRTDADDYAERWHATKAKFDRGEEIDSDYGQDVSYEPGDPEPGTPAFTQEHSPWSVEDHPDWTDREHYIDSWGGDITELKDEMEGVGYTGNIDDYIDEEKRQHYEGQKASKRFNLQSDHDPSTWFESDPQYWNRALQQAKKPTDEIANEARAEGEPETFSMFPTGLGAFDRVEGMGVEQPITLGLDPEVNVRGDIKRPIWEGEHDLISAYKQKPDVLIPVQHTSRSGSYGSMQNELHPHAERQEGAEEFIDIVQTAVAEKSHADEPRFRLSEEEEKAFWDVQPPRNLPGQMSLFD